MEEEDDLRFSLPVLCLWVVSGMLGWAIIWLLVCCTWSLMVWVWPT
jgi:hypothetical protein